jgi:hypothetical protein
MTSVILCTSEHARLSELEKAISKGQKQFVAVGLALAEIRDAKLYRGDFKTFAEYCETKWGWGKSHAYRLIEGAGIAKKMSPVGDVPSERVAREIAKVEPARREEVLAAAGTNPTARSIREAAAPPVAAPAVPAEVPTPPVSQDAPEAGQQGADIHRAFPTATKSSNKARRWWWQTAKPEQRGNFLRMLFAFSGPVHVADKGALIALVERWLEESVREVKHEKEGR